MRTIYLCGQTGSINRGCEAIVRSSVKVLKENNKKNICLATYTLEQDKMMIDELGIKAIEYAKYSSSFQRGICYIKRKIRKKSVAGQEILQKPLWTKMTHNDLCLNIGGDTYCYGRPVSSIALNQFTSKKGIDSILWCCSIEKDIMNGEILEDLKSYNYIFAREQLTYNALIEAGIPDSKVKKVCDPAFFLDKKVVELPDGFIEDNTVGINISPLTINDENPHAYTNVKRVIDYILQETDMNICLIPHVYDVEKNQQDIAILRQLYSEYDTGRISLIEKEYDCEQLKYIISKCRFFIGARTHSTIAAYSTGVPTLVIGYSVKSKGIATDLFGTYQGYVIPYNELTEANELMDCFKEIINNEENIRKRLSTYLSEYQKQLLTATNECL